MTVVLPPPVHLPMPPGDVEALRELVRDVRGAAFWLAELGDRLAGPAASAPGWLGADATAAAEQIVRVAALTRGAAEAVQTAAGRLTWHADLLADARRQVTGLRAEQDEDVRSAARRLGHYVDFQPLATTDSPAAYAIVADFESAERSRSRRCDAIAEEVEEDAAATGRVLADACAVVGGQGARGDAGRVVAYLAAELPGWGDLELARLGREASNALTHGTPADLQAAARAALTYAGSTAFAEALLAGLGADGVRWLLAAVGVHAFGAASDVPRLLATAFGSATGDDPAAAAVLTAIYASADDEGGDWGPVVAGMAAVLGISRSTPTGGLRTASVVAWALQLLLLEHEQGMPAGVIPAGWGVELHDPAALAVAILAGRADCGAAAELLGDSRVWETLLARTWPDDGASWAEVVTQAGQAPGAAGERAVLNGLVVMGGGLVAGDPTDRTVNRDMATTMSLALGLGVTTHVALVAGPLAASTHGEATSYSRDLLRGLGIVTANRPAAVLIEQALESWTETQPRVDEGVSDLTVRIPAAYRVVQDYGQRLLFAMDGDERRQEAKRAAWLWDHSVGLAVEFINKPLLGIPVRVVQGSITILMGVDGTWKNGVDHGLRFTRDAAVDAAISTMAPRGTEETLVVVHQARESYDGTLGVVGHPEAPVSPMSDPQKPLRDGALEAIHERPHG